MTFGRYFYYAEFQQGQLYHSINCELRERVNKLQVICYASAQGADLAEFTPNNFPWKSD